MCWGSCDIAKIIVVPVGSVGFVVIVVAVVVIDNADAAADDDDAMMTIIKNIMKIAALTAIV